VVPLSEVAKRMGFVIDEPADEDQVIDGFQEALARPETNAA
jgi:hypothetical protein